jgi:hypothetical protein
MKTIEDLTAGSPSKLVKTIVNLIWSSERSMPAHLTQNGDRTQSFCVDFEDMSAEDEYQMASVAWYEVDEHINPQDDITMQQRATMIRCGEDILIASYIVQKIQRTEIMNEVVEALIEMNTSSWPDNIDVPKVFATESAESWFTYCRKYGMEIAVASTKN